MPSASKGKKGKAQNSKGAKATGDDWMATRAAASSKQVVEATPVPDKKAAKTTEDDWMAARAAVASKKIAEATLVADQKAATKTDEPMVPAVVCSPNSMEMPVAVAPTRRTQRCGRK